MRLDPHIYGVNEEKEEDFLLLCYCGRKRKIFFLLIIQSWFLYSISIYSFFEQKQN